jgi:hypothetical protein
MAYRRELFRTSFLYKGNKQIPLLSTEAESKNLSTKYGKQCFWFI